MTSEYDSRAHTDRQIERAVRRILARQQAAMGGVDMTSVATAVATLQQQMAEQQARTAPKFIRVAVGRTAVAIAAGASFDVPVTWATTPSPVLVADATPSTGLLGNGTCAIKSGTTPTTTGCTVTVTATGLLLALGAQFIVVAAG